jgi:hypothetical protein
MRCRVCGSSLEPDLTIAPKAASSYATCVYRCEVCHIGYSNAQDPDQRRGLYERPAGNVPEQLVSGLEETLRGAFNKRARGSKWARFGSSSSEDAVTWSVMRFLQETKRLDRFASLNGMTDLAVGDPTLLLWGHPVAGPLGEQLKEQLASACDALGERENGRSEPDVIVAWPDLLVFAEAKTGSPNEILKGDARSKVDRYTNGRADIFTVPPQDVRATGYYELVRNWRLAADLANLAAIPNRLLINLGPAALQKDVLALRQMLACGDNVRLEHLRWAELLDGLDPPEWFATYVSSRKLMKM